MIRRAAVPADCAAIRRLLLECGLPAEDLEPHLHSFRVVEDQGELIACAALERHSDEGYLRSVAVSTTARGMGLGTKLTQDLLSAGPAEPPRTVWLMTLSAERFFSQFGFVRVLREEAPLWLRAHPHFQSFCPASAVLMRWDAPAPR